MKMIRCFLVFAWCGVINLILSAALAQTCRISGYVEDQRTGEKLIGANIFVPAYNRGTTTNPFGFFSLTVPAGEECRFVASYVGYRIYPLTINIKGDTLILIRLIQDTEIKEVTIIGERSRSQRTGSSFGMVYLNSAMVSKLPTLTGTPDILKSSQLLPGIQSGKEGSSQIYIRGGSSDQNLILLDDIPVYYVNHIGGFISVFDASAINSVSIYKGGFPAKYGGRLSGILDIRLREGSRQQKKQSLHLGLLSTEYKIEGPVKTDTSSYLLSVRRCNADIFTRIYSWVQSDWNYQAGYTFFDITAKYSHSLGSRNKLFFSTYLGRDRIFANGSEKSSDGIYRSKGLFTTHWGNYIASAKWNHVYSGSLFGSLTLAWSRFAYDKKLRGNSIRLADAVKTSSYDLSFGSNIQDILINYGFEKNLTVRHHLNFGLLNTMHFFKPYSYSISITDYTTQNEKHTSRQNSPESRAYFEDCFDISDQWTLTTGVQLACFWSDTRSYWALEPRVSSRFIVNDHISLSAGYSRMTQNLHLLSSSGMGLPTDLWIPATALIPPGESDQAGVGFSWEWAGKLPLHISVEAYVKTLRNLAEFREGAAFFQTGVDWQKSVETGGSGFSRGMEFLIEKTAGNLTGWVSYTLSKHDRTFPGLNGGKTFPFRYDRRHDLAIVANYQINENVNLCGTWVYQTGEGVTLSYGDYLVPVDFYTGTLIVETAHAYSSRNGYRLPDYHRLDLAIQFKRSFVEADRVISIGIYNVYNRKNPYFLIWNRDANGTGKLYQVSLFPIIPNISVAYNF